MTPLSDNAIRWLASGERGTSSEAIFEHLTGVKTEDPRCPRFHDHPLDPDDLRRCRLLLKQCPEFIPEFHRMASRSEVWARLVEKWDELCRTMDEECPKWRGMAHKTYDLMKAIGC